MTDQSTRYDEIVHLRNKEPEKVYIERADIHHFYWRFEANSILNLFQEPDYEPVMINENDRTTAISRLHWEGLVAWLSPKLEAGKPIVDFHTRNHIPIILTQNGKYRRIRDPKDIKARIYLECLFEPFIAAMLAGKKDLSYKQLLHYMQKYSNDKPIPDKSLLLKRKYNFLMIIGSQTIEKLQVLRALLSVFDLDEELQHENEVQLQHPL